MALLGALPVDPVGEPVVSMVGQRMGFSGLYPCSMRTDGEGRLWVASIVGGLFVGDGARFLKVELPPTLATRNGLGAMEVDSLDRIWVLNAAGLGCLERGTWKVDAEIRMQGEAGDQRGQGIYAHPTQGLLVLASGVAYRIPLHGPPERLGLPGEANLGDPGVGWWGEDLVAFRGAQVWRGRSGRWEAMPPVPLHPAERLRGSLRTDRGGHLYALTDRRLLHYVAAAATWEGLPYRPSPEGDVLSPLQEGGVWVLQPGQALRVMEGQVQALTLPRDMSTYGACARHLDAEGTLWMANTSLLRLPLGARLRVHGTSDDPMRSGVWRILRDTRGRLWAATQKGPYRWDGKGWTGNPGIPAAQELVSGPDGALYLRSQRRLLRLDPETLKATPCPIPRSAGVEDVRRGPVCLEQDLWVVDGEGSLLRGRWGGSTWTWTREEAPPSPPRGTPYVRLDGAGRLWLLYPDRTYVRERGAWEEVADLRGRGVLDIDLSTAEGGHVIQHHPPTLLAVRRTQGGWTASVELGPEQLLGIGSICSLKADTDGVLWLGTERGLVRFERRARRQLVRFGSDVGLPSEDLNQEALLVEPGKRIWIGTTQGLAELRTADALRHPDLRPPVVLEVRCGSWRDTGSRNAAVVKYGQGPVVWELGFPGPICGEGARFQFREPGGSWSEIPGQALQFPEIPPGRYAYEVRVLPFLGDPGPARRLELRVLPPWFRHPVAYVCYGGLLLGAGALLLRWRVLALERRNRALGEAVALATAGLRSRERELEGLNRRLYDLNEAKNRVIGLAAHDLRNPLSGILLSCDLLEEEPDPKTQRDSALRIRALGRSMMDLIQRLLDVHAIEAGHAEEPRLETLPLRLEVGLACHGAMGRAVQKGMTLEVEDGPEAEVLADPGQLQQMLSNYLSNAMKYAPPGTTVRVRLSEEPAFWRVEVQDQGPGLTAEDLTQVFTDYSRLSARPTGDETSVGLGLALVKRLAKGMGGQVGVVSTPGEGACFWFELPKPSA